MQTLEAMRRRIASAEDLHAVVRVMKALAAVSIRQYEKAVESLAAYHQTIEDGLQIVLRNRLDELAAVEAPPGKRWGMVVFGSDQGMCGSFNEQVANFALRTMDDLASERGDGTVVVVGARLVGRLEDAGVAVAEPIAVPSAVAGITPIVESLLLKIERLRFREDIDRFLLVHHRPRAGTASEPQTLQLLPVDRAWLNALAIRRWQSQSLPAYTMEWRQLFSSLIRQHLFVALYRAFAESLASENASRLASMQAAEKNIDDHLVQLKNRYRQERQQSITEELLDIVAGFETLANESKGRQIQHPN